MRNNKKRKGFTIVELVIVIAVIGILAAILIPTFINLTARANRVSNESFVKNINTQLAMDDAQNKKHESIDSALAAAKKIGFHVDDITPYEGNDIIWDEVHDRFAIVKGDFAEAGNQNADHVVFADSTFDPSTPLHKLWKFYDAKPATQTYSIAPKGAWDNIVFDDLKVGFNACEKTTNSVSYIRTSGAPQTVSITTNGGALEINAPGDVVKHHGAADSVNIIAVASTSYHENGEVGFAKIANGRLVLGEQAKMDGIYLVANQSGEFDGIKLAVVGEAKLPEIARSDVNLNDGESKLVVEIQTLATPESVDEHPQYVWISKTGEEIDSKVSSSKTDSSAVVENPTPAAAATKEETKQSAAPITDDSEARIGAKGYETLVDAILAVNESGEGDKISVLKDIDFSTETYSGYKWAGSVCNPLRILASDVTLDLGGHEFSNMGNNALCAGYILAADGRISNFTIENGSLKVGKTDGVNNSYALDLAGVEGAVIKNMTILGGINIYTGSKDVVIENCTVQGTKYYTVCAQSGSHVTIKGNSFGKNTDSSVANPSMFWVDKAGTDSDCATTENPTGAYEASSITVESGSYTVAIGGSFYLTSYLKPVVKGGVFNFDPTAFVAEGHTVTNNDNGIWTVA